jgi:hypothetical protein
MLSFADLALVALIGIGATAVMDAWMFIMARVGVQSSNFALIGRWVGYMPSGQFAHASIAMAAPIESELTLGWLTHYAIGIAYAGALVVIMGFDWARQPTLLPALIFGVATVAAPLLVMQPAMGAGFASTKTPTPLRNCLRSTVNHAAFGVGLYVAAAFIQWTLE